MKLRKLKRVISGLFLTVMAMVCLVASVAAEGGDTTQAEVEFSLKYLDILPKKGQKNFTDWLELMNSDDLNVNRLDNVKHKNGEIEKKYINEKKVYSQIETKVKKLKKKVDDSTPKSDMTEDEIEDEIEKGNISKYYKLPRNWRIADEIYRWVAENIKYDYDSLKKDENGQESFRKPQDALFVYHERMGICSGKSNLLNLMMRMAGISSAIVVSIEDKDGDAHAYNAIYLEDDNNADRTGWTLLDSTDGCKQGAEDYFPAFYNDKLKFKQANKNIIRDSGHRIANLIVDYVGDEYSDDWLFIIDGVNYELAGKEGNAYIHLNGEDDKKPLEKIEISAYLVDLGMKFEVGDGIKSLILKGDETVDLSNAKDLDSIDISKSNKYIAENGVIYEKNIYGSKGNALIMPENVKVLGEKGRVINKQNQERLKKLYQQFLTKVDEYYQCLAFNSDGAFLSYQKIKECSIIRDEFREMYNGMESNPTDDNLKIFEDSLKDFIVHSEESMNTIKAQNYCMVF